MDGEQVEFAGEVDVGDDAVDGLERGELGELGEVAREAVGRETVSVRAEIAEHQHVVEAVVVEVADEAARVVGTGDGRELKADRREDGVGVEQRAEGVGAGADEQAVVAVVVEIDHAERPDEFVGVAGEGLGGVIDELDRDAGGVRLCQLERDAHLGVAAHFPMPRLVGHFFAGNALLMQLERGLGFVRAAERRERLAQSVGCAEVICLECGHLLEQHGGFLGIAGSQLRLAEQIAHRADSVVDVVGLLQRLGGLGRLVESQVRAADQEMPGGEVGVDGQRFLCVLDDFHRVVGQAMGVGQVQQEVGLGGFGFQRPGEGVDGFLRLAGLVVCFPGVDR